MKTARIDVTPYSILWPSELRAQNQKLVIELILIGTLLVLFCDRVWRLGIVHTDDAMWALWAYDPTTDPIGDFARNMGRLWAFAIGPLWLHASAWNETLYGNLLKVLSFAIFFVTFHGFVWVYCGRRLALLSATLFLALNVLRWEESILTSVPLLSWGSVSLALIATLVARSYVKHRNPILLPLSVTLLFISLVCNEGVSLFIMVLFPWCLFWNEVQAGGASLRRMILPGSARRLLIAHFVCISTYILVAATWRVLNPTTYNGVMLAPFDIYRIAPAAISFATSGSIFHDLASSYGVTFADQFTKSGLAINYSPFRFVSGVAASPTGILAGGISTALILSLLLTPKGSRAWSFASPEIFAIVTGLALAFVPILPVAMTVQYQEWFFNLAVSSNSHSILCYFGVSLVLAVVVSMILKLVPNRASAVLTAIVALGVGGLAVTATRMSDAIATDMRPEAARWRVFALALDTLHSTKLQANNVLAPRFRNGSWFAVVPTSYWSNLAKARYGRSLNFVDPTEKFAGLKGDTIYLDYIYLNEPRSVVVTLAKLLQTERHGNLAVVAERVMIRVEQASQRLLDTTWITYVDADGKFHQSRLSGLSVSDSGKGILTVSGLVDPISIRIVSQASPANLPILDPTPCDEGKCQ